MGSLFSSFALDDRQHARALALACLATVFTLPACHAADKKNSANHAGPEPSSSVAARTTSKLTAKADGTLVFRGMCDASGAVRLSGQSILVANDDDNVLRIYDAEHGGAPLLETDLSTFVAGDDKHRETNAASQESDIEAAAIAFGKAYFVTSHARGPHGEKDDSLSRFFSTTLPAAGNAPAPVGTSYADLRHDLVHDPVSKGFKLHKAAGIGPEEPGGFNIEGLASAPDGKSLLIGFRNPLSDGHALVIPLLDAQNVTEMGMLAHFAPPIVLDLGGRGVRDLAAHPGGIFILAGPVAKDGDFALYAWDGSSTSVTLVPSSAFGGLTPEALLVFGDEKSGTRLLALSDDGDVIVGSDGSDGKGEGQGVKCGKLKPHALRSFRGVWLRLLPG
jgi:hypothetical protein